MRRGWLLLLACCTRPVAAPPVPDAGGEVVRTSSGGGTAGDFFELAHGARQVQALDCGEDDGGFWCIERVGPSSQRALVHYRWKARRLVGDLDHLEDAGDPPCDTVTLERPTPVHPLPSRVTSYSRFVPGRAIAGDGAPTGWLDAGVEVRVVQQAIDADGQTWLELGGERTGWVPARCATER